MEIKQILKHYKKLKGELSPREFAVIEMRFKEKKTLEEVGRNFSVTRERIRQIEEKAIEKLRIYILCRWCGKDIVGYPALSRLDNKTEICSDCGTMEALIQFSLRTGKKFNFE